MALTKLKEMLLKDWLAKLISVIVAVLLWMYVNNEKLPVKYNNKDVNSKIETNLQTTIVSNIKIEVKNLPENLIIVNTNDLYANASVTGPFERLEKLAKTNDFLFIDLKGTLQPGTQKLLIQYTIPENCKVSNIDPKDVMVNIEKH